MSFRNRIRKIQKLINLSNNAIKEFGFRYFINTAILELKQNKFAIFTPDLDNDVIFTTYSEDKEYQSWLSRNKTTGKKISQIKNELYNFKYKPEITIVISLEDNNVNLIRTILQSLQEQIYENFTVILYTSNSIKREIVVILKEFQNSIKISFHDNKHDSINSFVKSISSDFIVFLNNNNILTNDALFYIIKSINDNPNVEIIYSDEDEFDKEQKRIKPFFKPDWSPNLFLSQDYISTFYVLKKSLVEVEEFRENFGVAKHYELLLRLTDSKRIIYHITKILTSVESSNKNNNSDFGTNAKRALEETLKRRNIKGQILTGLIPNTFRVKYHLMNNPKVSIIIPTKDQQDLLKRCLTAIEKNTSYKNYEIIIIDNNSKEENTLRYLSSLPYRVVKYNNPFNFSKINNLGITYATGEYFLFLNDDTAPLESDWLGNMLEICQQDKVGIVGAKLLLSDNTIQHAGWVYLNTGAGLHPFQRMDSKSGEFHGQINVIKDYSAVTGACLLIKKQVFNEIGGFDDEFDLYYGDSDICFSAIQAGYSVVYTPYAVLLHQGSSSIRKQSKMFFSTENHYHFINKWKHVKKGDPFYNPNLKFNYRINLE